MSSVRVRPEEKHMNAVNLQCRDICGQSWQTYVYPVRDGEDLKLCILAYSLQHYRQCRTFWKLDAMLSD